jgi:hypothetical protein
MDRGGVCIVTGRKHAWMEYVHMEERVYRRRCALLGCCISEKTYVVPMGVEDWGVFNFERRTYDDRRNDCNHLWEPWYWDHVRQYVRKCYFCNWYQYAKDLEAAPDDRWDLEEAMGRIDQSPER